MVPYAGSIADSLLNPAFDLNGVTEAVLALANANPQYRANDVRTIGVWNGEEDEGGAVYNVTYATGPFPTLEMSSEDVVKLEDWANLVKLCG